MRDIEQFLRREIAEFENFGACRFSLTHGSRNDLSREGQPGQSERFTWRTLSKSRLPFTNRVSLFSMDVLPLTLPLGRGSDATISVLRISDYLSKCGVLTIDLRPSLQANPFRA